MKLLTFRKLTSNSDRNIILQEMLILLITKFCLELCEFIKVIDYSDNLILFRLACVKLECKIVDTI